MKLVKSIVFQARYRENEPAVAFPGGVATYGALIKSVSAAVEALKTFDLAPGTPVMLDLRNPIHHTATIFALALLGLPSASVGTSFVAEKAGFLPKLFLTDRDGLSVAGTRLIRVDERWFAADPASRPAYQRLLTLPGFSGPDDVVRYVYSSGTTGYPKCIALTQRCLELRVEHSHLSGGWWTHSSARLSMMGFSTIMGIMYPLLSHGEGGLLCYAGTTSEALQMVNLFRISSLFLAVGQLPPVFDLLEGQPPPNSLRLMGLSGARIPSALLTEARARICDTVVFGYGSTELGALSMGFGTGVHIPEGYAGHVLPWAAVEAVDGDGRPVAPGVEGVLRAQSSELAFYVDADGKPIDMLENGWFYPGDIGTLAADGTLVVTGRASEVINRGGMIVAPDAIEEVLRLDPRITDVAVVGIPNARGIEEIWAAVVSNSLIDPQAIRDAARPRLNEKVPDHVVQVNVIPKAENAKVRRNELRDLLKSRAGTKP